MTAFFYAENTMKKELKHYQQRIQERLSNVTIDSDVPSQRLQKAIKYVTLNNGKRMRPAIIYAVAKSLSIDLIKVDALAVAIELIHSYSLVHDDLPAMDDDALRRGQPTCHIEFDEATAILAGDAQLTLAFEHLSKSESLSDTEKVTAIQLLSLAAGQSGMISGQMIDIESEGHLPDLSTLKKMHQLKTGKLIECAFLMGAICHENYSELQPNLSQIGLNIGLAFQIQDDILDIESTTETLGKPQGSDAEADKSTYPKLIGIMESKALRDELILQAKQQINLLGLKSEFLNGLIQYVATRTH